jgi:CIC family chloride channel protein
MMPASIRRVLDHRVAGRHRERLLAVGRRSQQVLLLAGATGAIVGLVVAGFERLTAEVLLETVLDQPLWVQAGAPALGLLVAAACLRAGGPGTSPATSDEYIRAFHETSGSMPFRLVPYRLLAAVATLGSGGPLGYEGPALYAGAGIGAAIQRRLRRFFTPEDAKVLLVAGAAAGVAAIFKAPVTGLVFALEVPYQEDLARRMLLPAATSAAASYVVFAAIAGTDPILPIAGQPPFNLVDLGGAAVVGLAAGLLARAFIVLVQAAKRASGRGNPALRAVIAGAVLAATVLLADVLGDASLGLGPGYHALEWALDPQHSLLAIIALGTLRVTATVAVVGGGGTGGLFIPLVIQGALVGRAVGGAFEVDTTTLFPLVGMAAFLGAGYRVPLAAVVFVAEFTGRPGFVVPGLIAAVVAQLVMGRASISPYQVAGRTGHLERRLQLSLDAVVNTEAHTAPPDATVEELFWQHLVGTRQQSVAIVDGNTYLGIASAEDVSGVDRSEWATTLARAVMRTDIPVADMTWRLGDAIRAIEDAGSDRIAVCDGATFVGVITAADLIELDEVLDRTSRPPGTQR